MDQQIVLPTAFFPNLAYFSILLNDKAIHIEAYEHFVKQSLRNRCVINGPQGKLTLSIPLVHSGNKTLTGNKIISYQEKWQNKHWRAIESAYRNSPYFEYFEDEIKKLFFEQKELLIDFNESLILCISKLLRKNIELIKTKNYQSTYNLDLREEKKISDQVQHFPEYYQVFKSSIGFTANLSILDLLFNEGLFSVDYLKELKFNNI